MFLINFSLTCRDNIFPRYMHICEFFHMEKNIYKSKTFSDVPKLFVS